MHLNHDDGMTASAYRNAPCAPTAQHVRHIEAWMDSVLVNSPIPPARARITQAARSPGWLAHGTERGRIGWMALFGVKHAD